MGMTEMDANRRLAELLGWTEIVNVGGAWLGKPPAGAPACRNQAKVPNWTGDWRDCGPLMARHVRRMKLWPHRVVVGTTPDFDLPRDRAGRDDDDAVRRLIVDAVIAGLEGPR